MTPELPEMFTLRQTLVSRRLADPARAVRDQILAQRERLSGLRGASVAVGCSSRGITGYAAIVGAVVGTLSELGLQPFCFPAMGSHGSASAAGQAAVLARAGIDEQTMGCPVRSSLDVAMLDPLPSGMPVAMDRHASGADALVVVNRVKPHTEFTHSFESGLMKMLAIGIGKELGATTYHRYFLRDGYAATIEAVADRVRAATDLLFGVAIGEDGLGQTAEVDVIPGTELPSREAAMLARVRAMMPRLPVDDVDVLVIDEMGKDISGSGFDTKVVGRLSMPLLGPDPETPRVKRIVVCDLTDVSGGNADGVGIADFVTQRLVDKIDREALYVNALAGSEPEHARLPMVMPTDRDAVTAALTTIGPVPTAEVRLLHIRSTKDLATLEASAALVDECRALAGVQVADDGHPLSFTDGQLRVLTA